MTIIFGIITAILIWIVSSGKDYNVLTSGEKKFRAVIGYVIFALIILTIGSCVCSLKPDPYMDEKPDGAHTF